MIALVLILVPAGIMLAALIAAARTSGGGHGPGHDDEQGSGGGGGSDRLPRPPLTPPGAGEPAWWPQFERDLAEYVSRRREGAPLM